MTSMLEKMARAICQERFLDGGIGDDGWEAASPALRADYLAQALAVLKAIREPDEGTRLVGGYTQKYGKTEDERYAHGIWQAMIDHIIGEGE